jgi:hypothetical protein
MEAPLSGEEQPASLVDSVEIDVGPPIRDSAGGASSFYLPLNQQHWRSRPTASGGGGETTMRRPPAVNDGSRCCWIDPASVAFARNWKPGQDQCDATIVADLEWQCPDATPLEWLLRETPLTVVPAAVTLYSAIPNAAGEAARSKRRMVEDGDDAAKPASTKRRKGSAATLKIVSSSSKKRTRIYNDSWQHKFEFLCAFQRENGHCRVPRSCIVDSVRLGQWVNNQRLYYQYSKKGRVAPITEERIAQLNSIGFEWSLKASMSDTDAWQLKFELLCAFKRENGHCRVPQNFIVDSVKLGKWVRNQRQLCRSRVAPITEERIAHLNSIGFEWRLTAEKDSGTRFGKSGPWVNEQKEPLPQLQERQRCTNHRGAYSAAHLD